MPETNWGTMEDAARILCVSTKTIRRRIADGSIKAMKLGPRLVRVDLNSLNVAGRGMVWGAA